MVATVAVLFAVPACGGDDDDVTSAATSGSSSVALEGTTWELTSGAQIGASSADITVTARFQDGSLAGRSGCNDYITSYELDGTSLTVGSDIAGTRKACPPAETAVERTYLERLPRTASYRIEGSSLTLASSDGASLLEYKATGGTDALIGSWTVISYYAGDAITTVLGGADLTTEFRAQDVSGDAGCNTFSGAYEVDGDEIAIGPLASTMKACPDEELQQQEADYLAALQLATTYTVTGTRLDLFRPGGTYAATLQRS